MKSTGFGITFSEMWKLYRSSGMSSESPWFSIGYRKMNGTWGFKSQVRRVAGIPQSQKAERKDFKSISQEVRRAGSMHLEGSDGHRFELKTVGLMEFNGLKIDHRF